MEQHPPLGGGGSINTRKNGFDSSSVVGARYSNEGALVASIANGDGGRYDINDISGDEYSGTISYFDSNSSDGAMFEVTYQRDYSSKGYSNRKGIKVTGFKEYQEGEW